MRLSFIPLLFLFSLTLTACSFPATPTPDHFATALVEIKTPSPTSNPATKTAEPQASQTNAPPTHTPDPNTPQGKIVYTCQTTYRSAFNQLCLVNADGSGFRQLTNNPNADHFFASFAPDGQSIVFSSNQDGEYNIYQMDLFGNQTRLTDGKDFYAPAVSPDNTRLVFTYNPGPDLTTSQLWLSDRSGGGRYPITNQAGGAWDASWSPEGSQILFASRVRQNTQLFIISVLGGEARQVTDYVGLRGRNDWSKHNLLSTYIGTSWNREIITFDLNGENRTYITDGGNNLAPSFSPDGNWITFTSYQDNYRDNNGCEIYVMRVDGTDVRRLTDNDYCDWQPRWGR